MENTLKVGIVGSFCFLFFFSMLFGVSVYAANQVTSPFHQPPSAIVKCPDCRAGWGVSGAKQTITMVSDNIVVPRLACSSRVLSLGAALVAIDGSTSNDFALTGVQWLCYNGKPAYLGFWTSENTMQFGTTAFAIRAGDKVSLNITEYAGNFVFSLADTTAKHALTGQASDRGAASDSAACFTFMESNPYTRAYYPQANFGKLNVNSCLVDKAGIGKTKFTLIEYICVNGTGTKILALPSELSGKSLDDFAVSFKGAGP